MQMSRLLCAMLLAGAAMLAMPRTSSAADAAARLEAIAVTGTAVTEEAADMADISFALEENAASAETARNALAGRIEILKKSLSSQRIAGKDIKTSGYYFNPRYEYVKDKRVKRGYTAAVTVNVTVRDLSRLSSVMDDAITLASASIRRLDFDLSDRDGISRALLKEAVADAREKAAIVAAAGGRTLGVLIHANIGNAGGASRVDRQNEASPMNYGKAALSAEASPTELYPGTISVSCSVYTEFALK